LGQISRTNNDKIPPESDNNSVISLQACKASKEHKQAPKLQNLGTRISPETHRRFLQFLLDKHGKINGVFGQELDNAIGSYIDKQQHAASYGGSFNNKTGRPRGDVIEKYKLIVLELKQLKSFPLINLPTLQSVVGKVLGKTDKRTFDKHLRAIGKLSKEQYTPFGTMPSFDVTRFVNKLQSDDW